MGNTQQRTRSSENSYDGHCQFSWIKALGGSFAPNKNGAGESPGGPVWVPSLVGELRSGIIQSK